MSLKISLAMEDHTNDQYIAVPVIRAILTDLGKPKALIKPVTNPRITGIESLKVQASDLLDRYGAISDLVLFVVDADGEDGSPGRGNRVASMRDRINGSPRSEQGLVVVAQQELEVWALWGARSELNARWIDVRDERDPKERFFEPLITDADLLVPGQGRARLIGQSLSSGLRSLMSGCPEIGQLREDLRAKLG